MRHVVPSLTPGLALALALGLAPAACDTSSGGAAPAQGNTGQAETFFDDFFGGSSTSATRGGSAESDSAGQADPNDPTAPGSGDGTASPDPDCAGEACEEPATGEGGGMIVDVEVLVCEGPIAGPSNALSECQTFCAGVAPCLGVDSAAIGACAADCAGSVGGIDGVALQQVFGCVVSASCDDILDWMGGGEDAREEPPTPNTDTPPPTDGGTEPAPGGSDSGGADSPPTETPGSGGDDGSGGGDDSPDIGSWEPNPVDVCIRGAAEGWMETPSSASDAEACAELMAFSDGCDNDSVTVDAPPDAGSGSSSEPGEPPSSGAPTPDGGDTDVPPDAGDGSSGDAGGEGGDVEVEVGGDRDEAGCRVLAAIVNDAAMSRFVACGAAGGCGAYEDCMEATMVCMPFLQRMLGGGGSSVGSSGSGTVEPVPAPAPTPTEPDDGGAPDAP